jgi:hypothetical protein
MNRETDRIPAGRDAQFETGSTLSGEPIKRERWVAHDLRDAERDLRAQKPALEEGLHDDSSPIVW